MGCEEQHLGKMKNVPHSNGAASIIDFLSKIAQILAYLHQAMYATIRTTLRGRCR